MTLGISSVERVLIVPTWQQPSLAGPLQDDTTALPRVLLDGLALDRSQLGAREDHAPPPASAGMMVTSSPSRSGVFKPWSASIPSLLTKMLTW